MYSCNPPPPHSKSKILSSKILSHRTQLGGRFLLLHPRPPNWSIFPPPISPKPSHPIDVHLRLRGEAVAEICNLDDSGREVKWTFWHQQVKCLEIVDGSRWGRHLWSSVQIKCSTICHMTTVNILELAYGHTLPSL